MIKDIRFARIWPELFLVATMQIITQVCLGDGPGSTLPPSNPRYPIDLGTIDYPISVNPAQRMFLCKKYRVELLWNNPDISTRYFKFHVANAGSRLVMQMTENPTQSMWYKIYDGNLNWIRDEVGAQNEVINETFSQGDHYVRIVTEGGQQHLPDNKNIGDILIRAYPPLYPFEQSPESAVVDLGQLTSTVDRTGILANVARRNISFPIIPSGQICPGGTTEGMLISFREYRFQVSGPARIDIGVGKRLDIEWPNGTNDFGLWINRPSDGRWWKISNGIIDHPGGPLRIGVGMDPSSPTAWFNDAYMQYRFVISRLAPSGPNPGGPPSQVIVIPHVRQDLAVGSSVLISSWFNITGTWTQYRITQTGPIVAPGDWADGYLTLNGNQFLGQPPGSVMILPPNRHPGTAIVTAAQLSQIVFHAGTAGIENLISLHGFDGTNWKPIAAAVIKSVAPQ